MISLFSGRFKGSLRIVAFITVSVFTFETALQAAPPIPVSAMTPIRVESMLPIPTPPFIHSPSIPITPQLGKVEEVFAPQGQSVKAPFIYLIQDAHDSLDAQENIRRILKTLVEKNSVSSVCFEGGSLELDRSFYAQARGVKLNGKIWDSLFKKGEMSGLDRYALEAPRSAHFYGIEDEKIYFENIHKIQRIFSEQEKSKEVLAQIDQAFNELAGRLLVGDLKKLRDLRKGFESKRLSLASYAKELARQAEKTANLDLHNTSLQDQWPALVRIMKLMELETSLSKNQAEVQKELKTIGLRTQHSGLKFIWNPAEHWRVRGHLRWYFEHWLDSTHYRLPTVLKDWIGFQILQDEIIPQQLFQEIERLEGVLYEKLGASENAKTFLALERECILSRKLLDLELTRKEWQEIQAKNVDIKPLAKGVVELYKKTFGHGPKINLWKARNVLSLFKESKENYGIVEERDRVLTRRFFERLESTKSKRAALIVGGFHADFFAQEMKARGMGFAVITPTISNLEHRLNYRARMNPGANTPRPLRGHPSREGNQKVPSIKRGGAEGDGVCNPAQTALVDPAAVDPTNPDTKIFRDHWVDVAFEEVHANQGLAPQGSGRSLGAEKQDPDAVRGQIESFKLLAAGAVRVGDFKQAAIEFSQAINLLDQNPTMTDVEKAELYLGRAAANFTFIMEFIQAQDTASPTGEIWQAFQDVRSDYEKVLELDPSNPHARRGIEDINDKIEIMTRFMHQRGYEFGPMAESLGRSQKTFSNKKLEEIYSGLNNGKTGYVDQPSVDRFLPLLFSKDSYTRFLVFQILDKIFQINSDLASIENAGEFLRLFHLNKNESWALNFEFFLGALKGLFLGILLFPLMVLSLVIPFFRTVVMNILDRINQSVRGIDRKNTQSEVEKALGLFEKSNKDLALYGKFARSIDAMYLAPGTKLYLKLEVMGRVRAGIPEDKIQSELKQDLIPDLRVLTAVQGNIPDLGLIGFHFGNGREKSGKAAAYSNFYSGFSGLPVLGSNILNEGSGALIQVQPTFYPVLMLILNDYANQEILDRDQTLLTEIVQRLNEGSVTLLILSALGFPIDLGNLKDHLKRTLNLRQLSLSPDGVEADEAAPLLTILFDRVPGSLFSWEDLEKDLERKALFSSLYAASKYDVNKNVILQGFTLRLEDFYKSKLSLSPETVKVLVGTAFIEYFQGGFERKSLRENWFFPYVEELLERLQNRPLRQQFEEFIDSEMAEIKDQLLPKESLRRKIINQVTSGELRAGKIVPSLIETLYKEDTGSSRWQEAVRYLGAAKTNLSKKALEAILAKTEDEDAKRALREALGEVQPKILPMVTPAESRAGPSGPSAASLGTGTMTKPKLDLLRFAKGKGWLKPTLYSHEIDVVEALLDGKTREAIAKESRRSVKEISETADEAFRNVNKVFHRMLRYADGALSKSQLEAVRRLWRTEKEIAKELKVSSKRLSLLFQTAFWRLNQVSFPLPSRPNSYGTVRPPKPKVEKRKVPRFDPTNPTPWGKFEELQGRSIWWLIQHHPHRDELIEAVNEALFPQLFSEGTPAKPIHHGKIVKSFLDREDEVIELASKTNLSDVFSRVFKTLSYREREVLKLRWGLGDGYTYTKDEVGDIFKISPGRVWQIEVGALQKLQLPARKNRLRGFFEDLADEARVAVEFPILTSSPAQFVGAEFCASVTRSKTPHTHFTDEQIGQRVMALNLCFRLEEGSDLAGIEGLSTEDLAKIFLVGYGSAAYLGLYEKYLKEKDPKKKKVLEERLKISATDDMAALKNRIEEIKNTKKIHHAQKKRGVEGWPVVTKRYLAYLREEDPDRKRALEHEIRAQLLWNMHHTKTIFERKMMNLIMKGRFNHLGLTRDVLRASQSPWQDSGESLWVMYFDQAGAIKFKKIVFEKSRHFGEFFTEEDRKAIEGKLPKGFQFYSLIIQPPSLTASDHRKIFIHKVKQALFYKMTDPSEKRDQILAALDKEIGNKEHPSHIREALQEVHQYYQMGFRYEPLGLAPGRESLPHQRLAIRDLVEILEAPWQSRQSHGAVLADPARSGKTVEAGGALLNFRDENGDRKVKKTIWITKKRAKGEVRDELLKRFSDIGDPLILEGTLEEKKTNFSEQAKDRQFVILHYEEAAHLTEEIKAYNPDAIVIDEVHHLRNLDTVRAPKIFDLQAKYKIVISSRPQLKKVKDRYAYYHWLFPSKYPNALDFGKYESFEGRQKIFVESLDFTVRRPIRTGKIENKLVEVPYTEEQDKVIRSMRQDFLAWNEESVKAGGKVNRVVALARILREKQASNSLLLVGDRIRILDGGTLIGEILPGQPQVQLFGQTFEKRVDHELSMLTLVPDKRGPPIAIPIQVDENSRRKASSFVYGDKTYSAQFMIDLRDSSKLTETLEILSRVLANENEKALIFVEYRAIAQILEQAINQYFGDGTAVKILGGTSIEDQDDTIERFRNSPEPRVLISSYGTVAESLDLTPEEGASFKTRTVILFDKIFRLIDAADRLLGPNQTEPVTVYHLINQFRKARRSKKPDLQTVDEHREALVGEEEKIFQQAVDGLGLFEEIDSTSIESQIIDRILEETGSQPADRTLIESASESGKSLGQADDWPASWSPSGIPESDIIDGNIYHQALFQNGDSRYPVSWHAANTKKLIEMALPHIKDGDVVVDYGTGTGGSAIELLKALDARGIKITLVCVDPFTSWFSHAWKEMQNRPENLSQVKFYLLREDQDPTKKIITLPEVLGVHKAKVIISASTLHLIPEKIFSALAKNITDSLVPGGALIWNSGDIVDPSQPQNAALIHDPYRMTRAALEKDPEYQAALAALPSDDDRKKVLKDAAFMFPVPPKTDFMKEAFQKAGLEGGLSFETIMMDYPDSVQFMKTPRLMKIAGAIKDPVKRDEMIQRYLSQALQQLRLEGKANQFGYRMYWTFGEYKKPAAASLGRVPNNQLFNAFVMVSAIAAFYFLGLLPNVSEPWKISLAKNVFIMFVFDILSDLLQKRTLHESLSTRRDFYLAVSGAAKYSLVNTAFTIIFYWVINLIPEPVGMPARVLLATFVQAAVDTRLRLRFFHIHGKEGKKDQLERRRYESKWLSRFYSLARSVVVQNLPFWLRPTAEVLLSRGNSMFHAWGQHVNQPTLVGRQHWVQAIQRVVWSERLALMVYGVVAPPVNLYRYFRPEKKIESAKKSMEPVAEIALPVAGEPSQGEGRSLGRIPDSVWQDFGDQFEKIGLDDIGYNFKSGSSEIYFQNPTQVEDVYRVVHVAAQQQGVEQARQLFYGIGSVLIDSKYSLEESTRVTNRLHQFADALERDPHHLDDYWHILFFPKNQLPQRLTRTWRGSSRVLYYPGAGDDIELVIGEAPNIEMVDIREDGEELYQLVLRKVRIILSLVNAPGEEDDKNLQTKIREKIEQEGLSSFLQIVNTRLKTKLSGFQILRSGIDAAHKSFIIELEKGSERQTITYRYGVDAAQAMPENADLLRYNRFFLLTLSQIDNPERVMEFLQRIPVGTYLESGDRPIFYALMGLQQYEGRVGWYRKMESVPRSRLEQILKLEDVFAHPARHLILSSEKEPWKEWYQTLTGAKVPPLALPSKKEGRSLGRPGWNKIYPAVLAALMGLVACVSPNERLGPGSTKRTSQVAPSEPALVISARPTLERPAPREAPEPVQQQRFGLIKTAEISIDIRRNPRMVLSYQADSPQVVSFQFENSEHQKLLKDSDVLNSGMIVELEATPPGQFITRVIDLRDHLVPGLIDTEAVVEIVRSNRGLEMSPTLFESRDGKSLGAKSEVSDEVISWPADMKGLFARVDRAWEAMARNDRADYETAVQELREKNFLAFVMEVKDYPFIERWDQFLTEYLAFMERSASQIEKHGGRNFLKTSKPDSDFINRLISEIESFSQRFHREFSDGQEQLKRWEEKITKSQPFLRSDEVQKKAYLARIREHLPQIQQSIAHFDNLFREFESSSKVNRYRSLKLFEVVPAPKDYWRVFVVDPVRKHISILRHMTLNWDYPEFFKELDADTDYYSVHHLAGNLYQHVTRSGAWGAIFVFRFGAANPKFMAISIDNGPGINDIASTVQGKKFSESGARHIALKETVDLNPWVEITSKGRTWSKGISPRESAPQVRGTQIIVANSLGTKSGAEQSGEIFRRVTSPQFAADIERALQAGFRRVPPDRKSWGDAELETLRKKIFEGKSDVDLAALERYLRLSRKFGLDEALKLVNSEQNPQKLAQWRLATHGRDELRDIGNLIRQRFVSGLQPAERNTVMGMARFRVNATAVSPDGKTLASGGGDDVIRLWNLNKPGEAPRLLPAHEETVALAFTPDGKKLAAGLTDENIVLWNVESGNLEEPMLTTDYLTHPSRSLAFNRSGKILAAGYEDDRIRFWNMDHLTYQPWHTREANVGAITQIAFSPTDDSLVVAGMSHYVAVWPRNGLSGQPLSFSKPELSLVSGLAFSPDGNTLAISDQASGRTQLYHVPTFQKGDTGNFEGVRAAFSPDGKILATVVSSDILLWNLEKPASEPKVLKGHVGVISSIAFGPDGRTLVSGSADETIGLWRVDAGSSFQDGPVSLQYLIPSLHQPAGASLGTREIKLELADRWIFRHEGSTLAAFYEISEPRKEAEDLFKEFGVDTGKAGRYLFFWQQMYSALIAEREDPEKGLVLEVIPLSKDKLGGDQRKSSDFLKMYLKTLYERTVTPKRKIRGRVLGNSDRSYRLEDLNSKSEGIVQGLNEATISVTRYPSRRSRAESLGEKLDEKAVQRVLDAHFGDEENGLFGTTQTQGTFQSLSQPTESIKNVHGESLGKVPQPGEVIGGHFKVVEILPSGGQGYLMRADELTSDLQVKRTVVLKEVGGGDRKDKNGLLDGEVQFMEELGDHENIPKVFGKQGDDIDQFIVMEHIDGDTLKDLIDENKLTLQGGVGKLIPIAQALEFVHGKQGPHMDVKPANVMIRKDENGTPFLIDFGVAVRLKEGDQLMQSNLTTAAAKGGTIEFMSPEQIRDEDPAPSMDIWAFGVVLYQLAAGKLPFQAKGRKRPLQQVIQEDTPERPRVVAEREKRPEVPADLDNLIIRMLEKDPKKRPQTMKEVATALRNIRWSGMVVKKEEVLPVKRRVLSPERLKKIAEDHQQLAKQLANRKSANMLWLAIGYFILSGGVSLWSILQDYPISAVLVSAASGLIVSLCTLYLRKQFIVKTQKAEQTESKKVPAAAEQQETPEEIRGRIRELLIRAEAEMQADMQEVGSRAVGFIEEANQLASQLSESELSPDLARKIENDFDDIFSTVGSFEQLRDYYSVKLSEPATNADKIRWRIRRAEINYKNLNDPEKALEDLEVIVSMTAELASYSLDLDETVAKALLMKAEIHREKVHELRIRMAGPTPSDEERNQLEKAYRAANLALGAQLFSVNQYEPRLARLRAAVMALESDPESQEHKSEIEEDLEYLFHAPSIPAPTAELYLLRGKVHALKTLPDFNAVANDFFQAMARRKADHERTFDILIAQAEAHTAHALNYEPRSEERKKLEQEMDQAYQDAAKEIDEADSAVKITNRTERLASRAVSLVLTGHMEMGVQDFVHMSQSLRERGSSDEEIARLFLAKMGHKDQPVRQAAGIAFGNLVRQGTIDRQKGIEALTDVLTHSYRGEYEGAEIALGLIGEPAYHACLQLIEDPHLTRPQSSASASRAIGRMGAPVISALVQRLKQNTTPENRVLKLKALAAAVAHSGANGIIKAPVQTLIENASSTEGDSIRAAAIEGLGEVAKAIKTNHGDQELLDRIVIELHRLMEKNESDMLASAFINALSGLEEEENALVGKNEGEDDSSPTEAAQAVAEKKIQSRTKPDKSAAAATPETVSEQAKPESLKPAAVRPPLVVPSSAPEPASPAVPERGKPVGNHPALTVPFPAAESAKPVEPAPEEKAPEGPVAESLGKSFEAAYGNSLGAVRFNQLAARQVISPDIQHYFPEAFAALLEEQAVKPKVTRSLPALPAFVSKVIWQPIVALVNEDFFNQPEENQEALVLALSKGTKIILALKDTASYETKEELTLKLRNLAKKKNVSVFPVREKYLDRYLKNKTGFSVELRQAKFNFATDPDIFSQFILEPGVLAARDLVTVYEQLARFSLLSRTEKEKAYRWLGLEPDSDSRHWFIRQSVAEKLKELSAGKSTTERLAQAA